MSNALKVIPAAALLVALFMGIGMNLGPRAADIDAYMSTNQYAAEKAEHMARIGERP